MNIWLDKAGKQLVQWPVAEIENLRKTPVELQNTQLNGGSVLEFTGVMASQDGFYLLRFSARVL